MKKCCRGGSSIHFYAENQVHESAKIGLGQGEEIKTRGRGM